MTAQNSPATDPGSLPLVLSRPDLSARARELADRLAAVRARISEAVTTREVGEGYPELVVVTKKHPALDVALLAELGVEQFGENKDQEAAPKAGEVAAATDAAVHWNFVGQLQSNKARSVVRYADRVHSVDRASLVGALDRAVLAQERPPLECLLQISLDGAEGRGGVPRQQAESLADSVAEREGLRLRGVMAVAPLEWDPDRAFRELYEFSLKLRESHPGARMISAGMSHDVEQAIRWGATHVRIGTDVLGTRSAMG